MSEMKPFEPIPITLRLKAATARSDWVNVPLQVIFNCVPFKMATKAMSTQWIRRFVARSFCWRHAAGGLSAEKRKWKKTTTKKQQQQQQKNNNKKNKTKKQQQTTDIAKINNSLETCLEHNNWSPTYKLSYIYTYNFF